MVGTYSSPMEASWVITDGSRGVLWGLVASTENEVQEKEGSNELVVLLMAEILHHLRCMKPYK